MKQTIERRCIRASPGERAGSLLLYGPPGTSKTTLVRALAQGRGSDLVELNAGDFVQDGFERLERRTRRIFADLSRLENVVVLLDEMERLIEARPLARGRLPTTIADYVIPGMLPKLQDYRDMCVKNNSMFVITSNFRETIDAAAVRRGRLDHEHLILPNTKAARMEELGALIRRRLRAERLPRDWQRLVARMAERTTFMVYRDLEEAASAVVAAARRGTRVSDELLRAQRVRRALGRRSIDMSEVYSKERRRALPEFTRAVARVLDAELPPADGGRDDQRDLRLLRRLGRQLRLAVNAGQQRGYGDAPWLEGVCRLVEDELSSPRGQSTSPARR